MRFQMRLSLTAVLFALLSMACAPVSVTTHTEDEARFGTYRTFHALPSAIHIENETAETRELADQIQPVIEAELRSKGYQLGDSVNADLQAGFILESKQTHREVNAADQGTDYYVDTEFVVYTLAISLAETATSKPVWQGVGDVELSVGGALISQDRKKALIRTVRAILEKLPAPAQ